MIILSDRKEGETAEGLNHTYAETSAALARIELRLNLLEDDHLKLQALIREAEDMIRRAEAGDYDPRAAEGLTERVIEQTQTILKYEWDRVRSGELWFQAMKAAALAIILGAAAYALRY